MLEKLNLDFEKINPFFKQYKLEKFFNTVLNELNILFGYNALPFEVNEYAHALIDFSLESGIHGNGENGDQLINAQRNAKGNNKLKFLLSRWFIPVKSIFTIYPWTKSIILLPLGYVFRLGHLVFRRRKELKHVLNTEKLESNTLFDDVGLGE